MSKEDAFAQVYKGKHRAQEVAEFVSYAMAVWDRQHGRESVGWDKLSVHAQNNYIAKVSAYETERPSPKDDREVIEFELLDMLLPPLSKVTSAKEETKTVKEKEGPKTSIPTPLGSSTPASEQKPAPDSQPPKPSAPIK